MTTLSESTIVETDPETGGKVHDILDSRTHFEEPLTCDSKGIQWIVYMLNDNNDSGYQC